MDDLPRKLTRIRLETLLIRPFTGAWSRVIEEPGEWRGTIPSGSPGSGPHSVKIELLVVHLSTLYPLDENSSGGIFICSLRLNLGLPPCRMIRIRTMGDKFERWPRSKRPTHYYVVAVVSNSGGVI